VIDLSRCESPIESAFGAALAHALGSSLETAANEPPFGYAGRIRGRRTVFMMQPDIGWCRPDFIFLTSSGQQLSRVMVVELDGHDYHERTPEQARRDRARDRRMMALGWIVVRFTGREIHEDARACAEEALQLLFREPEVLPQ
jgi:very-short-patch-repair endonuclease